MYVLGRLKNDARISNLQKKIEEKSRKQILRSEEKKSVL